MNMNVFVKLSLVLVLYLKEPFDCTDHTCHTDNSAQIQELKKCPATTQCCFVKSSPEDIMTVGSRNVASTKCFSYEQVFLFSSQAAAVLDVLCTQTGVETKKKPYK